MTTTAIALATLQFVAWELALFAAAIRIAGLTGWRAAAEPNRLERWLAILAIQLTLESSVAAFFSFLGVNSTPAYWLVAAVLLVACARADSLPRPSSATPQLPFLAAIFTPLVFLAFRPVEEIDSINYLHYLIEWMANRATPYTFATNYVAFWELSFLPTWMVTRVDLFFPLLAAKAVLLLALALWLAGRELGLPKPLLLWAVAGSLLMRHYWYLHSGIPTLKNDALHGVGFVLLALVVLRAAQRSLTSTDLALLAFGAAFASVKYTGIFAAIIALALVLVLRRPRAVPILAGSAFFLLTSGHYYLHNLIRDGSPFYPFQINFAFIHLPGTADLSNTSILYSLHDPRVWQALFLPNGGLSPAGLLFPEILAGILLTTAGICLRAAYVWLRNRTQPSPRDWVAFLILCGWLLYFRSVFSASGYAGDLAFLRNNLNSIRYVDGVLALSELFLLSLLTRSAWFAWPLVILNIGSRAVDLYSRIPTAVFAPILVAAAALGVLLLLLTLKRHAIVTVWICLVAAGPFLVERNRVQWTTYWNDLKPTLQSVDRNQLAELVLTDGGYFAGHVVAAGNPVSPEVRALLPDDLDALVPAVRPRFLAVLVTPGSEAASDWRSRYRDRLSKWGYGFKSESAFGALLERTF